MHGFVPEELHMRLKSLGTQMPRLIGSAKIHKARVPLRTILCLRNSACHKSASWLVDSIFRTIK